MFTSHLKLIKDTNNIIAYSRIYDLLIKYLSIKKSYVKSAPRSRHEQIEHSIKLYSDNTDTKL